MSPKFRYVLAARENDCPPCKLINAFAQPLQHTNTSTSKAFTLVEIMIVVTIIGLLAALAIPAFQKVRAKSQDTSVLNNIRLLAAAADQYYMEKGRWVSSLHQSGRIFLLR